MSELCKWLQWLVHLQAAPLSADGQRTLIDAVRQTAAWLSGVQPIRDPSLERRP